MCFFLYVGRSWFSGRLRRNNLIHKKGSAHCLHLMKVFQWRYIEILFYITAQNIPRSPYIHTDLHRHTRIQDSIHGLLSYYLYACLNLFRYAIDYTLRLGCLEPPNECLGSCLSSFLDKQTRCGGWLVQKTIRE